MIAAVLCAVFVMTSAALQDRPSAGGDDAVATLTQLEATWNQAHLQLDPAPLSAIFADDASVVVPGMPPMTKDQALGFLRSGRMKFDRYETSDIHVRPYGDAAVVTGRLQRSRTVNAQKVDDDWRFTKTYIRQGGTWKVVAFHASSDNQ
jgi:ketosteroid isomerase-like protein